MSTFSAIKPNETAILDRASIALLFQRHGAACAEERVISAVEKLTQHLHQIERGQRQKVLNNVAENADQARTIAKDMGMVSLAQSLAHFLNAAAREDWSALSAIWQRVTRLGDQSLVALWDMPQLRI